MPSRSRTLTLLVVSLLAGATAGQAQQPPPCDGLASTIQITESIRDSERAVLQATVNNAGAPYAFTVNWGDGSAPETGLETESQLVLRHEYDLISQLAVVLELRLANRTGRCAPLIVSVSDDDDQVPRLTWTLPPRWCAPASPRWWAGASLTRAGSTTCRSSCRALRAPSPASIRPRAAST